MTPSESSRIRRLINLAGFSFALAAFVLIAAQTPAAAAGLEKFSRSNAASSFRIDNSAYDRFLKKYLVNLPDGITRVKYADVSAKDRRSLDLYIEGLQRTRVTGLSRGEQFAFWINLYNAVTLTVVLDHYPVSSIKDIRISPGLFSSGPWGRKIVAVENVALSLDDIEHEILRKFWREKRIHYAVSCASYGCPNLSITAFTTKNTARLLDAGARAYINHPRGLSIRNNKITASKIYKWYREDFGTKADLLRHFLKYAKPGLKAKLKNAAEIENYIYSWKLNDASPSGNNS